MPLGKLIPSSYYKDEAYDDIVNFVHKAKFDGSLLSGYLAGVHKGGSKVEELSQRFTDMKDCSLSQAIPVNSATSGLLAACMAAGVGFGSEVIVSPLTMSGTAAPAAILGARIVFCDVDRNTLCMDADKLPELITENTKAVIATDLFGNMPDIKRLRKICDSHNIVLVEDASQAIFSEIYQGESVTKSGVSSHIGVFSFNVHKQVQTGEGGLVLVNDTNLVNGIYDAINHGEVRGGGMGLNLRMNEITATMALTQLGNASTWCDPRFYAEHLNTIRGKVSWLDIPEPQEGCLSNYVWWGYQTEFADERWLEEHNIRFATNDHRDPDYVYLNHGYTYLPKMDAFRRFDLNNTPTAHAAARGIVTLELCSHRFTSEQIDYIRKALLGS